MQEIKKSRILIASVLKPVDEPRMFERVGQTLAAHGFDIFITGFPASLMNEKESIHFLPHKKTKRLSFERWAIRFQVLKKALNLKPHYFIITTHELLIVAVIYRIVTGNKIIYDVQENYWRNVLYTHAFPKWLRPFLAIAVRLKEFATGYFIDHFLLAEKCYVQELPFTADKATVIENKCKVPNDFTRNVSDKNIELLFTGTLAESTGVFKAIDLAKKLFTYEPRIRLKIVGRCALPSTLEKIKNEVAAHAFISLIGGDEFVSHETILAAIASSHFGIIYYPPSPHTRNKIPSKLYEYLACRLPILLQNNPAWVSPSESNSIVVDFDDPDGDFILSKMKEHAFYTTEIADAHWESEEAKLIQCINSLK